MLERGKRGGDRGYRPQDASCAVEGAELPHKAAVSPIGRGTAAGDGVDGANVWTAEEAKALASFCKGRIISVLASAQ